MGTDILGDYIWLCCATWVSAIFKHCFDIEMGPMRNAVYCYAKPGGYVNPNFKVISKAELQCGDLVIWYSSYGHIGMYLGDGLVTDCTSSIYPGRGNGTNKCGGVYVRGFWDGVKYLRYTGDATLSDDALDFEGAIDSVINNVKYWIYGEVPFRTESESNIDKDQTFEYQGIAKLESETTTEEGTEDTEESWIFSVLSDILEWILNFFVTIIKAFFVGLGTLVQVLVTFYIDAASGEAVETRLSDGMMAYFTSGGLKEDISNSITMEKIVYNKVPLLDVDVFNADADGLTAKIRSVVASLYMGIRQASMIALLVVLLYYGVRFVTTAIAEEKVEYRQKLKNWAVAFFIVFGIHYFLIAVMKINEVTVNLLSNIGTNIASELSDGQYYNLADAMRELTYQSGVVKSILSTCLYLAMVYYLVKFLVIYFKRLFVTIILIIFAPLMGIKFAVDTLKFKKSSSLTTWAKEYIFSVGTQTIHALVYTIFIGMTYKIALDVDTAKMAVCILAFMFFRFMTEAEKLLRKFLKLSGNSASSIMGDANSTGIGELFGWTLLTRMKGYSKNINKSFNVQDRMKKKYNTGKNFMLHKVENEYVAIKRDEYIEKYAGAYETFKPGKEREFNSDIDKQIEEVLKSEIRYKINKTLDGVGQSWSLTKGVGSVFVGIPIAIVENTLVGTATAATGGHTVIKILGGPIKGYRSPSTIEKYRAKNGSYQALQAWANQNATQKVAEELRKQYLHTSDDTLADNQLKIELLHQARKAEMDMQNEIALQKEKLLKGADGAKGTSKIQSELAETYTKKLRRSIEDRMRTVDRKDIKNQVKDYMKKNNKSYLSMEDLKLIAEELDEKAIKGELGSELSELIKNSENLDGLFNIEELTENVRKETVAKVVSEIVEVDGVGKSITLDPEVMDKVENNIKEKMENTANEEEKQSMLIAIKCIEDKRHEIEGAEKINVYSNLDPEAQQKVKNIIENAADRKEIADKQVTKLNRDQIIDTMKKAVDKDGSMQKEHPPLNIPEFQPILQQVDKMKEINELAKDMGENPVYKDVGQLVENMIKNTNIRLDKDKIK